MSHWRVLVSSEPELVQYLSDQLHSSILEVACYAFYTSVLVYTLHVIGTCPKLVTLAILVQHLCLDRLVNRRIEQVTSSPSSCYSYYHVGIHDGAHGSGLDNCQLDVYCSWRNTTRRLPSRVGEPCHRLGNLYTCPFRGQRFHSGVCTGAWRQYLASSAKWSQSVVLRYGGVGLSTTVHGS